MRLKTNKHNGFSLIEILLYILTVGVLVAAIASVSTILVSNQLRTPVLSQLESQLLTTTTFIESAVRNAQSITSPTPGNTSNQLTMTVADIITEPVQISVAADQLIATYDDTSTAAISASPITVTNFTVKNLGTNDSTASLQITYTIGVENPSGRSELSATRSVQMTINNYN